MESLIKELREYVKERNWDNPVPADVAKSISIEAAEILEHFQWESPSADELKKNKEKYTDLRMEIADVFIYLLQMAMVLDINPDQAIREKLDHVKKKYPVEKIKGGREEYYKIKNSHRAKKIGK